MSLTKPFDLSEISSLWKFYSVDQGSEGGHFMTEREFGKFVVAVHGQDNTIEPNRVKNTLEMSVEDVKSTLKTQGKQVGKLCSSCVKRFFRSISHGFSKKYFTRVGTKYHFKLKNTLETSGEDATTTLVITSGLFGLR
jgi:hypothetical protein